MKISVAVKFSFFYFFGVIVIITAIVPSTNTTISFRSSCISSSHQQKKSQPKIFYFVGGEPSAAARSYRYSFFFIIIIHVFIYELRTSANKKKTNIHWISLLKLFYLSGIASLKRTSHLFAPIFFQSFPFPGLLIEHHTGVKWTHLAKKTKSKLWRMKMILLCAPFELFILRPMRCYSYSFCRFDVMTS